MGGRSKQAVTEENLWGVTWEKLSEILTEEDVMTILKSKAGQKKHVKQKYRMVIGQADHFDARAGGKNSKKNRGFACIQGKEEQIPMEKISEYREIARMLKDGKTVVKKDEDYKGALSGRKS